MCLSLTAAWSSTQSNHTTTTRIQKIIWFDKMFKFFLKFSENLVCTMYIVRERERPSHTQSLYNPKNLVQCELSVHICIVVTNMILWIIKVCSCVPWKHLRITITTTEKKRKGDLKKKINKPITISNTSFTIKENTVLLVQTNN